MCLTSQSSKNTYPDEGVGYKVFTKSEQFSRLYQGAYRSYFYTLGSLYQAKNLILLDDAEWPYKSGFHIFPDLESARILAAIIAERTTNQTVVIVRVTYKKVNACGYEIKKGEKLPVVVANYITLDSEVD